MDISIRIIEMFVHAVQDGKEVLYQVSADPFNDMKLYVKDKIELQPGEDINAALGRYKKFSSVYIFDKELPAGLDTLIGIYATLGEEGNFLSQYVVNENGKPVNMENRVAMLEASYQAERSRNEESYERLFNNGRVYVNDLVFDNPKAKNVFMINLGKDLGLDPIYHPTTFTVDGSHIGMEGYLTLVFPPMKDGK